MKELPILTETVMALSWKFPYSDLMLKGKVETRSRPTKYRGLVMICVSKKGYSIEELFEISGQFHGDRALKEAGFIRSDIPPLNGYAIAIGRLIDCWPMRQEDEEATYVRYNPKLWCWSFEDVTPIVPIKWKGTQGWKKVPDEIKAKIQFIPERAW